MRVLGLDYGSKTVGVAISDTLGWTAQSVETITRKSENKLRQTLARIEELAKLYEADRIVLGYPKHMNNDEGERCVRTEEFKEMLLSIEITIEEFIYIEGLYEDIISMIIVMWTPAT